MFTCGQVVNSILLSVRCSPAHSQLADCKNPSGERRCVARCPFTRQSLGHLLSRYVQYIFANVPSSLSRARPDFLPTMLAVGEAQYGSVFGRMSMSQLLGALGKM